MFRRGVTSAVKHHVRPLFSGGRAPNRATPTTEFQSSNCFFWSPRKLLPQFVGREAKAVKGEAEAVKGKARIRKSDWPDIKLTDEGKYVVRCVERKCTSQNRLFENMQRSTEKDIDVDFSDKPNLFVARRAHGNDQYFTALSLGEDGNLTPKYDIYPPLPPQGRFAFSGSCSGLFCFSDWESRIFLWNPTTDEFKILPPSQTFLEPPRPGVTIQMNGSEIWFDRESDDYKVMRFFTIYHEDDEGYHLGMKFEFELYSLKSDSWKKISCTDCWCSSYPSACFNGVYYIEAERVGDPTQVILSFDLSTGTFSTFPLPNIDESCPFCIQEYNGLLSILVYSTGENERSFELWVRMNGSWTRESVFHTDGVDIPISFLRNGELLFFVSLNRELELFDRGTAKLKHLGVHCYGDTYRLVIPFCESFAQLRGGSNNVEVQEQKKDEDGRMIEAEYEPPLVAA